jgi:DNA-binding NarL/FixJ family response regulator
MSEKVKIIMVDDHQIVRDGIKALISDESWIDIIGEASNHKELFALLEKAKPDLIMLDISMPEMSGIEIAKILTEQRPEIKLLMLSMYMSEEFITNAIEAGAKGYLTKTTSQEEIINALKTITGGGEFYSDSVSNILLKSFIKKTQNKSTDSKEQPIILTKRENEILKHFAEGLSNKEIADRLFISIRTVESHKNNIMQKLELKSTVELIKYAIKNKIIEL